MKINQYTWKLVGLFLSYVLVGLLLKSVVDALSGMPTIWGNLFDDLARSLLEYSIAINVGFIVILVLMVLHVVWLVLELRRRQRCEDRREKRRVEALRQEDHRPTEVLPETEMAPGKKPEVHISWQAPDGSKGQQTFSFDMVMRRGGLNIGRSGHGDIGIADAGLAAKHLLLFVGEQNNVMIKHLMPGREGSVRVNGKVLSPGQVAALDGKTTVSLAASRIVISIQ